MEQVHQGHNSVLAKLTCVLQMCLESASADDSIPNAIIDTISQVTKLAQQCRVAHADHEAMESRLYKSLTTMKKGYELQKEIIASLKTTMGVERVNQSTNTELISCSACLSKDSQLQQHSALVSQQHVKILELEQQLKKSRFLMQAQQVLLDERQKKVGAVALTGKDRTQRWDGLFEDSMKRPAGGDGTTGPATTTIKATRKPPLPNPFISGHERCLHPAQCVRYTGYDSVPLLLTGSTVPARTGTESTTKDRRGRAGMNGEPAAPHEYVTEGANNDDFSCGVRDRYLGEDEGRECVVHKEQRTGLTGLVGEEGGEEPIYEDDVNASHDSMRSSERSAERSSADSATTVSYRSLQSLHSLDSNGSLQYDSSEYLDDDPIQHDEPVDERTDEPEPEPEPDASKHGNSYGWPPARYSAAGKGELHTTLSMNWADTVATQSVDLNDSFTLIQMCYSAGDDGVA